MGLLQNVDLDWLDYRNDRLQEACVISLPAVPSCISVAFVTGAAVVVVVGHLVYWAPRFFFNKFEINDDIKTLIWLGSDGLFKYNGLAAILAALAGSLGWLILEVWLRRKRREPRAKEAESLATEEEAWKEQRKVEAQKVAKVSRATMAHARISTVSQRMSVRPYKVGLLTEVPQVVSAATEPATGPCAL